MSEQFVMQMAGWMGSGKSTLARAVASRTGAVVLDHDTTKSAVLNADLPHPPAGAVSYEVLFAIAADVLDQGFSVIIDSPSLYASIPTRGQSLAAGVGASYYFVECDCPVKDADARIAARSARSSQVASAAEAAAVRSDPDRALHRPEQGAIVVDTTTDLDRCVEAALTHLLGGPSLSD